MILFLKIIFKFFKLFKTKLVIFLYTVVELEFSEILKLFFKIIFPLSAFLLIKKKLIADFFNPKIILQIIGCLPLL